MPKTILLPSWLVQRIVWKKRIQHRIRMWSTWHFLVFISFQNKGIGGKRLLHHILPWLMLHFRLSSRRSVIPRGNLRSCNTDISSILIFPSVFNHRDLRAKKKWATTICIVSEAIFCTSRCQKSGTKMSKCHVLVCIFRVRTWQQISMP